MLKGKYGKAVLVCGIAFVISGYASTKLVHGGKYGTSVYIECDTWAECHQHAERFCPVGYDLIRGGDPLIRGCASGVPFDKCNYGSAWARNCDGQFFMGRSSFSSTQEMYEAAVKLCLKIGEKGPLVSSDHPMFSNNFNFVPFSCVTDEPTDVPNTEGKLVAPKVIELTSDAITLTLGPYSSAQSVYEAAAEHCLKKGEKSHLLSSNYPQYVFGCQ